MSELDAETFGDSSQDQIETGSILLSRLALVGEGVLPREWFQPLSKHDFKILQTEPDVGKFPAHMQQLADFIMECTDEGEWVLEGEDYEEEAEVEEDEDLYDLSGDADIFSL